MAVFLCDCVFPVSFSCRLNAVTSNRADVQVVLAHQQDDDTTILKQFDPSKSESERCRSGSLARMEAARMKVLSDFGEEDSHDNL